MTTRQALAGRELGVLAIAASGPLTHAVERPVPSYDNGPFVLRWRSVPTLDLAFLDLDGGRGLDVVLVDEHMLASLADLTELAESAGDTTVVLVATDAGWERRLAATRAGASDVLQRDVLDDEEAFTVILSQVVERAVLRRELEAADAVAGHERELRTMLVSPDTASVSEQMLGQAPLYERSTGFWARAVTEYRRILLLAVEQRHFRVEGDPSADLRSLADLLCWAQATPADVMRLHREVVRQLAPSTAGRERIELLGEVRVRVLELMGAVASRYRTASINVRQTARTPDGVPAGDDS